MTQSATAGATAASATAPAAAVHPTPPEPSGAAQDAQRAGPSAGAPLAEEAPRLPAGPPAPTAGPTRPPTAPIQPLLIGNSPHHLSDLYHYVMVAPWSRFIAMVVLAYVTANGFFALLFLAGGDCIANARPGSFADAFFFSVQTMATIGYGAMAPCTPYAHVLVTIEALCGLLGVAMATGLLFAKFARPTARVIFSKSALITARNGTPHLVFRVANARANQIVEATVRLIALKMEVTEEGEQMRRLHELALVRHQNPLFALTWTVMHPIDERSPLHGLSIDALRAMDMTLLVMLVGIDGTFAQTIHARHIYTMHDIVPNARFVDMLRQLPDGQRGVDLRVIDDYVPQGTG